MQLTFGRQHFTSMSATRCLWRKLSCCSVKSLASSYRSTAVKTRRYSSGESPGAAAPVPSRAGAADLRGGRYPQRPAYRLLITMRSIERPGASYSLPPCPALRYSPPAVAKSAAGRGNPSNSKATQHAPCVFLCRSLCSLIFARWMLCYRSSQSMVAQAGLTSVRPVFLEAGISTPSGLPPISVETSVVAITFTLRRLPPWLRPSPRLTRHSAICLRPYAVLR